MGGQLILQSIPGVGSTFSFSARFERGNAAAKTSAFSIAGAHALIVDDDPVAREILTRYASAWSLNADAAPNGSEAFEMLRRRARTQTPYDVAIIDYTMPGGMGGLELGKRIKADPSLARTQLILITAYKGLQQRQAASTAGFTSYLTKPVDRAQLFDYLARSITCARAIDAGEQPAAPPRASSGASKRILLVEDNPINQHLGMQQLKKLGFDVSAANNGEQALAALAVKPFDIIFMDCQMPTMDGFAATRAIRASEEHTGGHVTIVAMTANALVEDRRTCLAAGMDDYLSKPVRIDDLETMIQRWIWDPAIAK
ncbi:MAG: response regulator [Candidatus Eremiobacteraeota bacterium]|nr:response regulator [Candidatus Eremiobacteraeota bacterium]